MRFDDLNSWLDWQASLNPAEIELGLERIDRVRERAALAKRFDCPLISVAGTNGKGSVVAMLEAIARAAGYRVCSYTSPHILRYNERIKIDGEVIDDESLCRAFELIDQKRGDEALTYFEFGTLAAIELFMRAKADLVIMEVGLGGRLDAVNIMDPDVAVITAIDIDHTDWLGPTRETIATEKAGILRGAKPAICGDANPPQTLLAAAEACGAQLQLLNRDYRIESQADHWNMHSQYGALNDLPLPALKGAHQLDNAATAIMALQSLAPKLTISAEHLVQGLTTTRLPGRFQQLHTQPVVIVDVAHNTQSVTALVNALQAQHFAGETHIVIAMLADKPVAEAIEQLSEVADYWFSAGLDSVPRGLSAVDMAAAIERMLKHKSSVDQSQLNVKLRAESSVSAACKAALQQAATQDRIIILGSFYTVAEATGFFSGLKQPYSES